MLNTVAASVNFNVAVPPEDWVIGQCVVCRLSEQPLSHMISHKMQGGLTCLDWNLRPRYLDTEFPKLAKIVWLGQKCSVSSPCAAAELFKGSRTPQSGFVALPMQCKVCISRGVGHVDTDSWIANYADFLQTFCKWWTSSKVWQIYGSKYLIVFTYYMYIISTCVFFHLRLSTTKMRKWWRLLWNSFAALKEIRRANPFWSAKADAWEDSGSWFRALDHWSTVPEGLISTVSIDVLLAF